MSNEQTQVAENPEMVQWRPYADGEGYVLFKRRYRWSSKTYYYRYSFRSNVLQSVYSKNLKTPVPRSYMYSTPERHIIYDKLEVMIPKHLQVDEGL